MIILIIQFDEKHCGKVSWYFPQDSTERTEERSWNV